MPALRVQASCSLTDYRSTYPDDMENGVSRPFFGGGWDALATNRADLVIGVSRRCTTGVGMPHIKLAMLNSSLRWLRVTHLLALWINHRCHELLKHRAVAIADTACQFSTRSSGLLDGQDEVLEDATLTAGCHATWFPNINRRKNHQFHIGYCANCHSDLTNWFRVPPSQKSCGWQGLRR